MVAALTRIFGVHNLALAEDVVQDAFCRALEVWRIRGVPENSSACLMAAAKNRALDVLRRERTARSFAPELGRFLQSEWTLAQVVEELFTADAIKDDLLRMMFSCCDPRVPEQAQVALVLHILCGFSVSEIASAFVSTGRKTREELGGSGDGGYWDRRLAGRRAPGARDDTCWPERDCPVACRAGSRGELGANRTAGRWRVAGAGNRGR